MTNKFSIRDFITLLLHSSILHAYKKMLTGFIGYVYIKQPS